MSFLPHDNSRVMPWYGSLTVSALTHAGVVGFFMFSGLVAFLPEPQKTAAREPQFAVSLEILDAEIVDETTPESVIPDDAIPLDPNDQILGAQPDEPDALTPELQALTPEDEILSPEGDALAPSENVSLPDEPEVSEAQASDPVALEPQATEPVVSEADVVTPEALEPEAALPETAELDTPEPLVPEAEVSDPVVVEPEPTEPQITEPEVAELQPADTTVATPDPEPVPVASEPETPSPLAIGSLSPIDNSVLNPLAQGGAAPLPEFNPQDEDALTLTPEPAVEPDVLAVVVPEPTPEPPVTAPDDTTVAPVALPEPVEPVVADPVVTAPEVVQPEVTAPVTPDPTVVEPEVTEPVVVEPEVTEPAVVEPQVTDPIVADPEVAETPVVEPEIADPVIAEPEVTDPPVVEPQPSEPVVAQPEVTDTDTTELALLAPEDTNPPTSDDPVQAVPAPEPARPATRPLDNPSASDVAIGQLLRRIRATAQPQCTLALPRRASGEPGAGVSLIGADLDVLDDLATRITSGLGFEPIQTREEIDPRQCATLDVLRQAESYPANRIGLALESASLVSGDTLRGRVIGANGLFVTLLLIDDNGVVQDMAPFVSLEEDGTPVFEAPVARSGPVRATRQILLALGTEGAPLDLEARIGNEAQVVFGPIPAETLRSMVFGVATFDVR
jgi:hypothetical protein